MDAVLRSVPAAARALGLGRTTTWALIRWGELPSVRVGKRVLIRRVDLEDWAATLVVEEGHLEGDEDD